MTILIAVALAALAPVVAPCSGAAEAETERTDVFRYDGVERVQVLDAQIFAVEVTGVGGGDLEAEVHVPANSTVGIEHRRSGGTVMIRAYRTERPSGWIGALPGGHRLVLRVPSRCELEVTTTTGSISVAGVAGPKKLAADTGSIAVRESPGPIAATTTTGSHAYSSVKGDVAARANTGGVRLDAVQGALSVTTHTGRIEGTGLVLTDDSSFEADTGSISLELDQTLDSFSFQLRSDTGRILVGDTEARGRLALGGGRTRLRAETDTGGIRIQGK